MRRSQITFVSMAIHNLFNQLTIISLLSLMMIKHQANELAISVKGTKMKIHKQSPMNLKTSTTTIEKNITRS